jgi:cytochrome c-type biogenesis protein
MTLDAGLGIGLAVAFIAGVVSFASPCCLPLVPAYIGYMVGATGELDRRRSTLHGVAFVIGFTLVFVAVWASIGLIGYVLADSMQYLRVLGGIVLVVFGLQVAGVINLRALWRDTRPMPAFGGAGGGSFSGGGTVALGGPSGSGLGSPGYGRSLGFGVVFAAGWSPCIGPILGGIIGLATTTASVASGTALLLAYAAGLAVPFLAVAMGATWVAHRLGWVGRHHRAVSLVSGTMLVVLGFLMATNLLARLAALSAPLGG